MTQGESVGYPCTIDSTCLTMEMLCGGGLLNIFTLGWKQVAGLGFKCSNFAKKKQETGSLIIFQRLRLRTRGNKMTQLSHNLTCLPSIKWPNRSWDQSLKCHTSPRPPPPPPTPGGRGGERRLNSERYIGIWWRHLVLLLCAPSGLGGWDMWHFGPLWPQHQWGRIESRVPVSFWISWLMW